MNSHRIVTVSTEEISEMDDNEVMNKNNTLTPGGTLDTLDAIKVTPLWLAEDGLADTESETAAAKIRIDIRNIKRFA